MKPVHTHHSAVRAQQRCVPPLIIDWLERYGCESHDGRGAVQRFFDRRSRRRLESDVGAVVMNRMEQFLDAYLVQSTDGLLITVGRRTRRISRR